jgi:hypothetical protein
MQYLCTGPGTARHCLLDRGVSLEEVQHLARHADPRTPAVRLSVAENHA